MFSKACEYGIRAAIHIAHQSKQDRRTSLKAVAKAIDSPVAFTAKILQALAKDGLIISTKGPTGGYEISGKKNAEITLLQIVKAIDGNKIYNGCSLGLKECNAEKPCPLHYQFVSIRSELKNMLAKTTIQSLANDLEEKTYFLKL